MAILTTSGRTAIATAVKANSLHLAWGRGKTEWDEQNIPREPRTAIALLDEIGRRKISIVQYCTPATDGEIITLSGRYMKSDAPTQNLHLGVEFDYNDGLGEVIREIGVFIGTETKPDLPEGQRYFTPADLTSPGTLLALDYISAIKRGVGARIGFDLVITF